jgi:hypothetical protein
MIVAKRNPTDLKKIQPRWRLSVEIQLARKSRKDLLG